MPDLPRYQRGQKKISAAGLNRQAELVERLANAVPGGGGEGNTNFSPDDYPLIGKITGVTLGADQLPAYTWKLQVLQQAINSAAPLTVDSNFFTDNMPNLAYELSSNPNVPTDGTAIVELYQSPDGPYLYFDWPESTFPARILARHDIQCPPSGSGSGSTASSSSITYAYDFVALKRVIDVNGCHDWNVDLTRHGIAYSKNNRKFDPPFVVDIEVINLHDLRSASGSGSGSFEGDGKEYIFDDGGGANDSICLKPGLIYSVDIDCQGNKLVKFLYATPMTFDANGCYGPGPPFLVASMLTSCTICPCDSGSGSGTIGGSACAACASTYCLGFAWTGNVGPQCAFLQANGIQLNLQSCTMTFGFGIGEWSGQTTMALDGSSAVFTATLSRYCFLAAGGIIKYRWFLYAYYLGPFGGCGRPLIHDPANSSSPLFIGEGTDPNVPPTVSGSTGCLDCSSQTFSPGTWMLASGVCPGQSGSGSSSCPCKWTAQTVFGVSCAWVADNPSTCHIPPAFPCVPGDVRYTNLDGSICTPTTFDCTNCPHTKKKVTFSACTGGYACLQGSSFTTNYDPSVGGWLWILNGMQCPCLNQSNHAAMACIDGVMYFAVEGQILATPGNGSCGSVTFTDSAIAGDNSCFAGQGGYTCTVTDA